MLKEELLFDKKTHSRRSIWSQQEVGINNKHPLFGKVERCYNDAKLSIVVDSYDFILNLIDWKKYDEQIVIECHKKLQQAMYDAIKPILDYHVAETLKEEQKKKEDEEKQKLEIENSKYISQEEFDKNTEEAKQKGLCACSDFYPAPPQLGENAIRCYHCDKYVWADRLYLTERNFYTLRQIKTINKDKR